jgi:beta-phosphoglucomutase family hydrolase
MGEGPHTELGLPGAVQACLLDLDGVLTATAAVHAQAWKRALDPFLVERAAEAGRRFEPFDPVRDYDLYVDGRPREDGIRSFLASRAIELPLGGEDDPPGAPTVRGLARRKDQLFVSLLQLEGVHAYPGSVRFLRAARDAGLRTAVVTSSSHGDEVLAAAQLEELIDVRVDGVRAAAEHLLGKPAPDTYLAAARALATPPGRAAVFEDALAGVEAGRAGGFGFVVGVDRAGQARALEKRGADRVVRDLAELLVSP